jgi:hypothetical protein
MSKGFNSSIRMELLELTSNELNIKTNSIGIKKLNTALKKNKEQKTSVKEEKEEIICLHSLDSPEGATREHTVIESGLNSPELCYKSYKLLKELAYQVKNQYVQKIDKKTRSSLILPNMNNRLVEDLEVIRCGLIKRNSCIIEEASLSFLKLIPCLEQPDGCFKIDLIQCEKY